MFSLKTVPKGMAVSESEANRLPKESKKITQPVELRQALKSIYGPAGGGDFQRRRAGPINKKKGEFRLRPFALLIKLT
jgi:hypothetical protein